MDTRERQGAARPVLVGTWRRRPTSGGPDHVIRLIRAGTSWEVHHTGAQPRRDLTQARALAEIAAIIGQSWTYYPPPRRHRGPVAR